MARRSNRSDASEQPLDIFQSFTDLISNAFMIVSFFLVLSLFQALALNEDLKAASPIIIDEESARFSFKSGSAELEPGLKNHIKSKVPEIEEIAQNPVIEFIQVIGHTDSEIIYGQSNLDELLNQAAQSEPSVSVSGLSPGSNVDLGLMRAIAVIQTLQKESPILREKKFRAYSAAQLYLPSGELASPDKSIVDDASRRRIEIRFVPFGQNK